MMLYPSIMDLMEKAGNRYSLVIAASKRARDILGDSGEESKNLDGARSITKAVEEIAAGEVVIVNESREKELEREAEYFAKMEAAQAAQISEEAEDAE